MQGSTSQVLRSLAMADEAWSNRSGYTPLVTMPEPTSRQRQLRSVRATALSALSAGHSRRRTLPAHTQNSRGTHRQQAPVLKGECPVCLRSALPLLEIGCSSAPQMHRLCVDCRARISDRCPMCRSQRMNAAHNHNGTGRAQQAAAQGENQIGAQDGAAIRAAQQQAWGDLARALEAGADPDERNSSLLATATPLHHAACHGHVPSIDLLVAAGATLEARDRAQAYFTPLHWAAMSGHLVATDALLRHGARYDAQDQFGCHAAQHALSCGHRSVAERLARCHEEGGGSVTWLADINAVIFD